MPKVKAIFYDLPDGSYPAQEFIDSLDIKMQAKSHPDSRIHQENPENPEKGTRQSNPLQRRILQQKGAQNEMKSFDSYLKDKMKDPEFKAEYDALEPEFSIMQAIIDARKESGLTQKQLSEKTGITQADISRLESGNANPSLHTLQRLASGMNMKLKLEFVKAATD